MKSQASGRLIEMVSYKALAESARTTFTKVSLKTTSSTVGVATFLKKACIGGPFTMVCATAEANSSAQKERCKKATGTWVYSNDRINLF